MVLRAEDCHPKATGVNGKLSLSFVIFRSDFWIIQCCALYYIHGQYNIYGASKANSNTASQA